MSLSEIFIFINFEIEIDTTFFIFPCGNSRVPEIFKKSYNSFYDNEKVNTVTTTNIGA